MSPSLLDSSRGLAVLSASPALLTSNGPLRLPRGRSQGVHRSPPTDWGLGGAPSRSGGNRPEGCGWLPPGGGPPIRQILASGEGCEAFMKPSRSGRRRPVRFRSLAVGRRAELPVRTVPPAHVATAHDPLNESPAILGKLRGEPATRWFDGSFAPIPRSDERFARQYRVPTSTAVSSGFVVARHRSPPFGSYRLHSRSAGGPERTRIKPAPPEGSRRPGLGSAVRLRGKKVLPAH